MQITLRDLLTEMNTAQQRMSRKNPHRVLLVHAVQVMTQMATRIQTLETARRRAPFLNWRRRHERLNAKETA